VDERRKGNHRRQSHRGPLQASTTAPNTPPDTLDCQSARDAQPPRTQWREEIVPIVKDLDGGCQARWARACSPRP
jgi:hypothetical protein